MRERANPSDVKKMTQNRIMATYLIINILIKKMTTRINISKKVSKKLAI
jgi:hypothetical protein